MSSSEKKIPKSLKECCVADNVSSNLWNWSNWLDVWGRIILVILIVIGIISTISSAVQIADIDEDLVFITVITSIMTWGLYAFLEYCAYHVLSLLVDSLATIVQNTRITADVALYTAAKEEETVEKQKVPQEEKKEIETKFKTNQKTDILEEKNKPIEAIVQDSQKKCPVCGVAQNLDRTVCWACGQKFEN